MNWVLILVIAILGIMYFFNIANQKINILTYDEFINSAKEGKITEIVIVPRSNAGLYELKGTMEGYKENESFFNSVVLQSVGLSKPETKLFGTASSVSGNNTFTLTSDAFHEEGKFFNPNMEYELVLQTYDIGNGTQFTITKVIVNCI